MYYVLFPGIFHRDLGIHGISLLVRWGFLGILLGDGACCADVAYVHHAFFLIYTRFFLVFRAVFPGLLRGKSQEPWCSPGICSIIYTVFQW